MHSHCLPSNTRILNSRIEKEQNYLIIASVTLPSGDVPFDASQYDSDRGGEFNPFVC